MSTTAIILIAVGAVLLVAAIAYFAVLSPRRREQRRLARARTEAADHYRERPTEPKSHADLAEQRAAEARVKAQGARQEAELAREEATVPQNRAELHDKGLADDELT